MSDFVVEGQWRQIQELLKEVERLKKSEAFVKEFVQYGFRIDTMPTRMFLGRGSQEAVEAQSAEYQWWHEYVSGAEKRLRDAAREALK